MHRLMLLYELSCKCLQIIFLCNEKYQNNGYLCAQKAIQAVVSELNKSYLRGTPTSFQVDLLRYYQWLHVNDVLSHPLNESYQTKIIENFNWDDWVDKDKTLTSPFQRGDIRLKKYPYSDAAIVDLK